MQERGNLFVIGAFAIIVWAVLYLLALAISNLFHFVPFYFALGFLIGLSAAVAVIFYHLYRTSRSWEDPNA